MSPPSEQIRKGNSPETIQATCAAINITETEFTDLQSRAASAKATAYCPYSQFRVGATLLASDGTFISGANIENASYPVGTCAERVAFGKAVTERKREFRALAVSTDISPPASPCGMCRQFIREFCKLDLPVIMFDKNEDYVVMTLEQLLPMSFGPDKLPPPGALGKN